MAAPLNQLSNGLWSVHREMSSPAADGAFSNSFPERRALLNAHSYPAIYAAVKLGGGGDEHVDLELWSYDEDDDKFYLLDSANNLKDGDTTRFPTENSRVFIKIPSMDGSPTSLKVKVIPSVAVFH